MYTNHNIPLRKLFYWTFIFSAEAYKDKFYQLHEVLVTNMENEQILMKRARALQKVGL